MPKSIPNPNPNPNVQDVAKPTWAHPNVRDVAKPAWAHPNVLDVAKPAWAPTLAAKPPEECKTESAGRIVKKYLHPAAGRIDTGFLLPKAEAEPRLRVIKTISHEWTGFN